jgi:hypothetical protein
LKVDHKNRYGILEGIKLASQIMPLKKWKEWKKKYFDFKWKNVFPTSNNGFIQ